MRTRLTLWYGGVLLAIVLVISAFSYFMLRRSLISGADVELLMVGQVVRDAGIGEALRGRSVGPRFLDVFYRSPTEYRDVLHSSLEEVEQLIALAENLLLLSRLRMELALPRHALELETLLMEVVDTGVRPADGRGVIVRLGPIEPLIVHADPLTLRRALVNLVENAIKYTKAGGKVELSLERDGEHAVVAVRDTGVEPSGRRSDLRAVRPARRGAHR